MKPPVSAVIAARTLATFPETVIQQLAQIETELGGRTQVVGLLMLAPLTPDLEYVLGLLGDPQHATESLAEICATADVMPADLLKLLSGAALLRGKLKASQKIGDGIAAVAEDVMRRAAPYEDTCNGGCRGTGSVTPDPTPEETNPRPGPCPTCNGTGKLRYQPTLDRQKLAIEMAQLLPKSGGIAIGVQQITQPPGEGGSRRAGLQALTDRLLYGQGPVIEATRVDEGEGDGT